MAFSMLQEPKTRKQGWRLGSVDAEPHDRRTADRFSIARELTYRVTGGRGARHAGTGTTLNISSNGVLFKPETPIPLGQQIELQISWPAQLNKCCALKLVARGRVTRVGEDGATAVEILQYEFRTAGLAA
ncbi:MAG TPA: PilZ domain-containing protein [Bryobacteraceae bacterium]|nr:PilZ domain-containing protein [Bryobacteraceae bacterium]